MKACMLEIIDEFGLDNNESNKIIVVTSNGVTYYQGGLDWLRGNRGWGSLATTTGPCGAAVSADSIAPSDFQQNPCSTIQWLNEWRRSTLVASGTNPENLEITEQEEAFADMFLNWVYRTNGNGGFSNVDGNGVPDSEEVYSNLQSEGPGDDRQIWMNQLLIELIKWSNGI